jgi:hypothetical protein
MPILFNCSTGVAVSDDGSFLAVGAPTNGNAFGYINIYQLAGITPTLVATIPGDSLTTSQRFGSTVALSDDGTVLAVGMQNADGGFLNAGELESSISMCLESQYLSSHSCLFSYISLLIGAIKVYDIVETSGSFSWTQKGSTIYGAAVDDMFASTGTCKHIDVYISGENSLHLFSNTVLLLLHSFILKW